MRLRRLLLEMRKRKKVESQHNLPRSHNIQQLLNLDSTLPQAASLAQAQKHLSKQTHNFLSPPQKILQNTTSPQKDPTSPPTNALASTPQATISPKSTISIPKIVPVPLLTPNVSLLFPVMSRPSLLTEVHPSTRQNLSKNFRKKKTERVKIFKFFS